MSATVQQTKPLRWSSVRSCPRKAVYEAEGAPARERTIKEERIMHRGRSLGRDYVISLATANEQKIWVDSGPDYWVPPELRAETRENAGIIAELQITWPLGTGHADAFVVETGTIIEVLSSAHASEEMKHSKLLQAAGYLTHYNEAKNLALVILNPSDFTEERVVVVPSSPLFATLMDEVEQRLAILSDWAMTGTAPARVCAKPTDAIGHFCQHAEHCFDGWEAPPLAEIAADEALIAAVQEFDAVKKMRGEIGRQDTALEARQKEAQKVIESAELPAKMGVQVGCFKVVRTSVQRGPTFDWEAAESAGRIDTAPLTEFFKPGASYSTFKTERVADEDFGEETPF